MVVYVPRIDRQCDAVITLSIFSYIFRKDVPWASYQIRKIAGCACAGNAGNVFPRRRFLREPLVSDPGMHHGTCVTHVPWCMPGSLTCGDGENVPGIPGACASAILCIWQEAHSSPVRAMYGVSILHPASDLYSTSVPVIIYEISYIIGPFYNSTLLYVQSCTYDSVV